MNILDTPLNPEELDEIKKQEKQDQEKIKQETTYLQNLDGNYYYNTPSGLVEGKAKVKNNKVEYTPKKIISSIQIGEMRTYKEIDTDQYIYKISIGLNGEIKVVEYFELQDFLKDYSFYIIDKDKVKEYIGYQTQKQPPTPIFTDGITYHEKEYKYYMNQERITTDQFNQEKVKEGIKILKEFKEINNLPNEVINTIFQWTIKAPFFYSLKQTGQTEDYKYLLIVGPPTCAKSPTARIFIEAVEGEFATSGRADTVPQLAERLNESKLPFCIDEAEEIVQYKSKMSQTASQLLKSNKDVNMIRSRNYGNKIGKRNIMFISNFTAGWTDANRKRTIEIELDKNSQLTDKDIELFNSFKQKYPKFEESLSILLKYIITLTAELMTKEKTKIDETIHKILTKMELTDFIQTYQAGDSIKLTKEYQQDILDKISATIEEEIYNQMRYINSNDYSLYYRLVKITGIKFPNTEKGYCYVGSKYLMNKGLNLKIKDILNITGEKRLVKDGMACAKVPIDIDTDNEEML